MGEKGGGYRRALGLAVVAGLLQTAASAAHAGQWDYGYGYAGEYSSNIRRTATEPEHEWINSVSAGFGFAENTDDLVAQITAQGMLRQYVGNTFDNQSLLFVDSSALWTISPRRLTWTVEDAFRQVVLNPTAPSTPDNQAGSNVFSTGPDVFLHLGPVNTLSLGARYGNVYVGDGDVDNSRYTGFVRWLYQASSTSVISLNAERAHVDFDNDTLNQDFDRTDAFVRYETRQARSLFGVDVGRTRIDRDGSEPLTGSLTRLTWTGQSTSESTLGLSLSGEYRDVGMGLLGFVTGPAPVTPGASTPIVTDVVTSDVYYTREARLSYVRRGAHWSLNLLGVGRDIDFEMTPQDRRETGGRTELSYFYSGADTLSLYADYLKTKYEQTLREDEDSTVGLRFGHRIVRNVTLGLEGYRIERSSTDPAAEYVDKRAIVTIAYSTGLIYGAPVRR